MRVRTGIACVLGTLTATTAAFAAAGFVKVGSMASERASAAAVTLPGGSVLVASGNTIERFDPVSRTFSPAGTLTTNRGTGLTITRLGSGQVLIVGGQAFDASQQTAELFDPTTGTSSATGSMSTPRSFHTATLLADGRVLIVGGHQFNFVNSALDTGELYDPTTGLFTPLLQTMGTRREGHTATLLADGRVLIAGGFVDLQPALSNVEIFDSGDLSFTPTGSLAQGRGSHTANRLADGRVVVAGGQSGIPGDSMDSAEIYDPALGSFADAGMMSVPRAGHSATSLADGTLLIAGGSTNLPYFGAPSASAEIYDPVAGAFTPTASMHEARSRHVAASLPGGEVLVAGGLGPCCGPGLASAEVFSASVVDTMPPVVTVPGDITVVQDRPEGAVVNYPPPSAVDDVDTSLTVDCHPASGSIFPVGVTPVACTTTDSSGNQGSATFYVTVLETLAVSLTIEASGKVDPRTGLAMLRGSVGCNRTATGYIALELSQVGGPQGSASRFFRCVPPSFDWMLSVSAQSGRFRPGPSQARISGQFCTLDCAFPSVERSVMLAAGAFGGGEFPMTKIADRATGIPGSRSTFGSFNIPFVNNGTVVFQGYGPTLSETGLYSSTGGRLAVIADTRTPIPGGTGNFTALDSPAFDGTSVVFEGQDAASGVGLYKSVSGSLSKVADSATPVPGEAGIFRGFVGPVVAGNRIAFRGSGELSVFGSFGVYVAVNQTLSRIADFQTPVPSGPGTFTFFGTRPVLDGDSVVFPASAAGFSHSGIYVSRNDVLTALVDTNTLIPGGSANFFAFGPPASDDGLIAFMGADSSFRQGIYRSDAGVLRKVVDHETPVPGRAATFGFVDNPVVENGVVAFGAVTATYEPAGLYASVGDDLAVLADVNTAVPGGQGLFSGFDTRLVLAGGSVAFLGADATGTSGIYVRRNGVVHKVISDTDSLDGKAVGFLRMATGESCDFYFCTQGYGAGFDGRHVVFQVSFGDGSTAIYLATLPQAP